MWGPNAGRVPRTSELIEPVRGPSFEEASESIGSVYV